MVKKYSKPKIILVAILVVIITFFHYTTEMWKIYFSPLILAGFWFGLKGGMVTSLVITALYFPEIIMKWQGFSPGRSQGLRCLSEGGT